MAQQQLNNNESAALFREKLNDNFTDLYTNKAIINHASAQSSYGLGDTTNYGHVKVSNGNGLSITNGAIAMAQGTTSAAGALQLVNNATTNDATKAATAAALKSVKDGGVVTYYGTTDPTSAIGKVGDIYIKIAA